MRYTRDLFFYFLEFVGALINLFGSLFGLYPRLELGLAFLLRKQGKSVEAELTKSQNKREEKEQQASEKSNEANRLSNG